MTMQDTMGKQPGNSFLNKCLQPITVAVSVVIYSIPIVAWAVSQSEINGYQDRRIAIIEEDSKITKTFSSAMIERLVRVEEGLKNQTLLLQEIRTNTSRR